MQTEASLSIVADIGGTNARFATVSRQNTPSKIIVLRTADYSGPGQAIKHYLAKTGQTRPQRITLAVAGPVFQDEIHITNSDWCFSISGLKAEFEYADISILNDLEAHALALPSLSSTQIKQIGSGDLAGHGDSTMAVVGPGTGLGIAALVHHQNGWQAMPSEGGYTSLSPANELELGVWHVIKSQHGRVSAERVLSGPGLVELYNALATLQGRTPAAIPPEEIAARALSRQDEMCISTVDLFCAWLGDLAGDVALMFCAFGGVYLTGGIAPSIIDIIERSQFRQRYISKGRGASVVEKVPTYVVTAKTPALLGCINRSASWK